MIVKQLFDRTGKKLVLNEAGRIFLKYCDQIIDSLQNAKLELSEYQNKAPADINIIIESVSLLLPDLIERIRQKAPAIMPHVFQSHYSDWDLKIWSDFKPTADNTSTVLLEEPIGIVMSGEHPLCTQEHITRQALEACTFISLSPSNNLYTIIHHFCTINGFNQTISMFVDSPSMMRDLVKMNLGIAFAPQYT